MVYAYEIKNDEAAILRCYGFGSEVELPGQIDKYPVAELGSYAFSAHIDRKRLGNEGVFLWDAEAQCPVSRVEPGIHGQELQGGSVTCVRLPSALRKIGAYAFYNCSALRSLSFSGRLCDLGAGLFTGCHNIRELELTLGDEGTSVLREILLEVPEKLTVHMKGSLRAEVVFPEFFEESVENTPARILVTQLHGSGMNYRNCFYAKKFDFRAYDGCFFRARAEEDTGTILEMTLGRLMYPVELTSENRRTYESWISENMEEILREVIAERDMDKLEFITGRFDTDVSVLHRCAALASSRDFAQGSAFLMDRLRRMPKRKSERWAL